MGLSCAGLDYIYECAQQGIGRLCGKRMLELGSQEIVEDPQTIPERTAKEYFERRQVEHISVDLNGEYGSLKVDLAKPIKNINWLGAFDIVTNAGVTEHVEPYPAQYQAFANIHSCLKSGGIAVHIIPDVQDLEDTGYWKRHSNNYYSQEFIKMLALNNNYRLISLKNQSGMLWACLQKKRDVPFMQDRQEFLRYIVRKKGGIIYPGINAWGFSSLLTLLLHHTRPLRQRWRLPRDTR